MRKTISILFSFLFILFTCKQNEKKERIITENKTTTIQDNKNDLNDFFGNWEMENNSKDDNDTFSINLSKSTSGTLNGHYCAVVRNGNKIDCAPHEEINIIEAKKQGNQYIVSFKSFFGATDGEAKISLTNGKLHWKVIKKPIGEFYCPLDAYLTKKGTRNSSNINSKKTLNLDDKNYKGTDITMQLYKDIIDYYGCGDNSVSGMRLGEFNSSEIFIVENACGDFPSKDLISIKNGKITDKLLIELSSFDTEKSETQNIKDQTNITFDIIDLSNIQIREIHSINDKVQNNTINKYFLDNGGKFHKK